MEDGTVSDPVDASVAVADPAAPADTAAPAEHTPDLDKLVADVEANWDKISPEKRAALDRHFQPAFNRKLNLLNQSIDTSMRSALADTGVTLPEGKSPLDLLTENDGKGFADFLRGVVAKELRPVNDSITQAQQVQTIRQNIDRAAIDYPELRPHLAEAVKIIDGDPDLTKIAMMGNGAGTYYAAQGVAAILANRAKDKTIGELKGLLEKNNIAIKTAGGTTRAGQGAPKTQQPAKPTTLKQAAEMAMKMIKADQEAEV